MSTQWLRLWHDLPNNPKWRTIARVSEQPLSSVISVYIHMLVCASTADDRGRLQGWNDEDIASALDLETEQITAIYQAMQGRVLDDDKVRGWEKRQPASDASRRPLPIEWAALRNFVFQRDDYTCQYCGERGVKLECDHVIPVSRGGGHDDENLVTACFVCNRSKRDKLLQEWLP